VCLIYLGNWNGGKVFAMCVDFCARISRFHIL
jgi:hypothetical protein